MFIILLITALVILIISLIIITHVRSVLPSTPVVSPVKPTSMMVNPTSIPVKPKPTYIGPSLQSMVTQLNKLQSELTAVSRQPAYQVPPVDGGTLWNIADDYIKVIGKIQEILPTGSINVILPNGSNQVITGNSSYMTCQKPLIKEAFNGSKICPVFYWLGQSFNTAKTSLNNATNNFTNTKSKKLLATITALNKNVNDYITFIIDKYST